MRYNRNYLSAITLLLLTFLHAVAQEPFDLDEIRVVAPYEPTISDAFKITLNPRIEDTLSLNLDFSYVVIPRKAITTFTPEPITPARMRGEPLTKLYRGTVRGGYGSYSTPYLEATYNTLRSNTNAFGVHLKHLSSGGGIDEVGNSAFSTNMAHLYGQRFMGRFAVDGSAKYERDVVHLYGYRRSLFEDDQTMLDYIDALTNDDIRQQFDKASGRFGFGTFHSDSSRMHHKYNIGYQYLSANGEATEQRLSLQGALGRNIAADPFGMADKQHLSIALQADYLMNRSPLDTLHTGLIALQPRLWSAYNAFRFYIGMNAAVQADTTSYFRAYPDIGAEFNVAGNRLVAFGSLSGRLEKNTLATLSENNPFLNTSGNFSFVNVRSDIGIGVKGSIGDIVGYGLSIHRAMIDNQPFFINDSSAMLNNRFDIVYDDIRRFTLKGELQARFGERFSARFSANYFQYGMDLLEEAWHMPTTLLSAHLRYAIQNKIIITSDIFSRSETLAPRFDQANNVARLPAFVDINAGIEYRYTKLLSVFFNFHNIRNQPLQQWFGYPSQGFNFLGGIAYSF